MKFLKLRSLLLFFLFSVLSLQAAPSNRKMVLDSLNTIVINEIELDDFTIEEVLKVLQNKSQNKINFLYLRNTKAKLPASPATNNFNLGINPLTGLPNQPPVLPPIPVAPVVDDSPRIISGNIILKNITLKQALDISTLCFDTPMQYTITDFGVVFSHRKANAESLFLRRFTVNPSIFKR